MAADKQETISFKLDSGLAGALKGMNNRSEFIRAAILSALGNLCPLCKGSGILDLSQRRHWDEFATNHPMVECEDCNTLHPVCNCDGHHNDPQQDCNHGG